MIDEVGMDLDLPASINDANFYHRFYCIIRNFLLVCARDNGTFDREQDMIALPCLHVAFRDALANKAALLCPDKALSLRELHDIQIEQEAAAGFNK